MTDWDAPSDGAPRDFATLIGAEADTIATIPASSVGTGLVAGMLGPGDEVVVPADEFTSSLFPLLVAKERGATVREVPFDDLAASDRTGHHARGVQPRPDADRQDGRPRGDHGGSGPPWRAGHDRRHAGRPVRAARGRHRPDRLHGRARATSTCCRRAGPATSTSGATTGTSSSHGTPTGARRTCRTSATSAAR